jgi:serine/threonine protein kinase
VVGIVVGGKYKLVGHLGGGAISEVSIARAEAGSTGPELVVIKRLKLGTDADADLLTQFAGEARVSLRLKHPNIVNALAGSEDAGGPFIVFEYLEGQTLGRIRGRASKRPGGLPRAFALHVITLITTGLANAHAALGDDGKPLRVVHRDVSPDNIMVTYDGETKLIDFSVATANAASLARRAGATKGNIAYMAPEQGKSAVNIDGRADVFAVGLVLWELLTGKRMWEGMSEADILARLAEDKPLPTLRSVVPDMPEEIDAICVTALAKVRDDRFDSAVELREAIEKATKKLGLEMTASAIGAFVTTLFEDEREKTRTMVADAVASPAESVQSLPSFRPPAPDSSGLLPAVASDPPLPVDAPPVRVQVIEIEKPSRDLRFQLLVGGAVLIAFAGVAVVALTQKDSKANDELAGVPRRGRPPEVVAPEPVMPAVVEPEEIMIEISVTPPTAQLTVDGVKAPSSLFRRKVVRGKYVHDVHAEAPGYEPRTAKLVFDRERTFEIALTPKRQIFVAPRPPAAPPPAPAPKPAPEAAPASPDPASSASP